MIGLDKCCLIRDDHKRVNLQENRDKNANHLKILPPQLTPCFLRSSLLNLPPSWPSFPHLLFYVLRDQYHTSYPSFLHEACKDKAVDRLRLQYKLLIEGRSVRAIQNLQNESF